MRWCVMFVDFVLSQYAYCTYFFYLQDDGGLRYGDKWILCKLDCVRGCFVGGVYMGECMCARLII